MKFWCWLRLKIWDGLILKECIFFFLVLVMVLLLFSSLGLVVLVLWGVLLIVKDEDLILGFCKNLLNLINSEFIMKFKCWIWVLENNCCDRFYK